MKRFLSLAAWLMSVGVTSLAFAQEPQNTADSRATEFRAMTGPAQESVPGGMLLVAAYGLIFSLVLLFVWRVAKMQSETRTRIEELASKLPGDKQA